MSQTFLIATLWVCLAAVVYAYLGYPLLVFVLARLFGKRQAPEFLPDAELPTLSLLIAAYNEEAVIAGRIENALALDYPADRLEIVVATDGCSDRTAEIVRGYADRGVRLLEYRHRRGKATVLNDSLPQLRGQVVMFSDANTCNHPDAGRRLVRWFSDPAVVAVCGRLILNDPASGRNSDGLYWKYETFIKCQEGKLGALLGANGGIYALRRNAYVPIPNDTILDDLVIPLLSRLHHGGKVVYDVTAVAQEETPPDIRAEFHRRSRIGAGGFGSVPLLAGLLNPRSGWVFFTFVSHKLLRWCGPFFLLGLLLTSALLADQPFYLGLLLAQAVFYLTALVSAYLPGRNRVCRVLRLTSMFAGMNGALLLGFYRWLRHGQNTCWKRTVRLAEAQVGTVLNGEHPRAVAGNVSGS